MRRPGTDWMRGWPMARCGYASKATKFRDALAGAASAAPARASLLLPRRVNAARGMLGGKGDRDARQVLSLLHRRQGDRRQHRSRRTGQVLRTEENTSELQSLITH